jgi:hypothetical protein
VIPVIPVVLQFNFCFLCFSPGDPPSLDFVTDNDYKPLVIDNENLFFCWDHDLHPIWRRTQASFDRRAAALPAVVFL